MTKSYYCSFKSPGHAGVCFHLLIRKSLSRIQHVLEFAPTESMQFSDFPITPENSEVLLLLHSCTWSSCNLIPQWLSFDFYQMLMRAETGKGKNRKKTRSINISSLNLNERETNHSNQCEIKPCTFSFNSKSIKNHQSRVFAFHRNMVLVWSYSSSIRRSIFTEDNSMFLVTEPVLATIVMQHSYQKPFVENYQSFGLQFYLIIWEVNTSLLATVLNVLAKQNYLFKSFCTP